MQIIGQEACYDSEADQIFIPFKDSNLLDNDLFQTCVIKLFYTNISGHLHYNNQINKDKNFWGPSRIRVTVVHQDMNTDHQQAQTSRVELTPEQSSPCSPSPLVWASTPLIMAYIGAGLILIIVVTPLIRRNTRRKIIQGVDLNPEYGEVYYYRDRHTKEGYGGSVQYVK